MHLVLVDWYSSRLLLVSPQVPVHRELAQIRCALSRPEEQVCCQELLLAHSQGQFAAVDLALVCLWRLVPWRVQELRKIELVVLDVVLVNAQAVEDGVDSGTGFLHPISTLGPALVGDKNVPLVPGHGEVGRRDPRLAQFLFCAKKIRRGPIHELTSA